MWNLWNVSWLFYMHSTDDRTASRCQDHFPSEIDNSQGISICEKRRVKDFACLKFRCNKLSSGDFPVFGGILALWFRPPWKGFFPIAENPAFATCNVACISLLLPAHNSYEPWIFNNLQKSCIGNITHYEVRFLSEGIVFSTTSSLLRFCVREVDTWRAAMLMWDLKGKHSATSADPFLFFTAIPPISGFRETKNTSWVPRFSDFHKLTHTYTTQYQTNLEQFMMKFVTSILPLFSVLAQFAPVESEK